MESTAESTEQTILDSDEKQDSEDSVPGELPETSIAERKATRSDDSDEEDEQDNSN